LYTDAGEGLLCDTEDSVVSATTANLFVLRDGRWLTPILDRCGVAGVCRAWLLRELDVQQVRLSVEEVETADAVVLTNAVRGILTVARLGARAWSPHPAVEAVRQRLALAHPGFANDVETS
ncbi:MAG: aminotransferase class IV, partial [Gammaproteobacteria bacterium]|nr:aminotransferase class IV [Gammaproteobacteria bacterium]